MPHPLVTVVGAGNVGASVAQRVAEGGLADVVLIDIVEGLPQGKALDLAEAAPVVGHDMKVTGTNDYADTAGSDVIVVTSGLARQPGMSRDDLLAKNAGIVRSVVQQAAAALAGRDPDHRHQPARRDVPRRARGERLPAGARDRHGRRARLGPLPHVHRGRSSASASAATHAFVLGGHGDTMVPLPRYSTAGGVPITELHETGAHRGARRRARATAAPRSSRCSRPGSCLLRAGRVGGPDGRLHPQRPQRDPALRGVPEGEYGVDGLFVGVPVKLGRAGISQIVEIELQADERAAFDQSAAAVRELVDAMDRMAASA